MCTFLAKFHKNSKGFTLAEVLIVVAIMSILAGFGFVAVSNYNKKLTLTEMDDTAKKIFLAAQNHLTIADANGEWKQLVNKKGTSIGDETCPTLGPSYYVIFGGKDTNSIADDVRKVMLPDQSVNLAGDGRYAIIFNKDTAAVYGVYYSASSTFGNGQDKIDFAGTIKKDIEYFDSDSSLTKFDNRKVQNPLIGYYGNSNNVGTKKEENTDIKIFQKLKIYFINSKELTLVIEDPNADIYRPLDSKEQLTRDFYITIKTSENPGYSVNATIKNENFLTINNTILNFSNQNSSVTNGIVLKDKNNVPTHLSITPTYLAKGSTSSVNEDVYFITFDSLTAAGKHFINLFQTMKPGLDVTADVTMTVNQDGKVTSLGGSATDNSLFEQIYPGNGGYTARVSNVRHLENLSQEISGVDIVDNGQQIKKAILTQNLDLDNDGYSIGTPIYASDGSRNKVLSADENFIGINVPKNSAFITFEGNKKTISNMRVVGAPFAASGESVGSGLFSSVNGDFSISNLTLEKPVVTGTTGESAGSVIGTFTGNSLSIKNINIDGDVAVEAEQQAGGVIGYAETENAVELSNVHIASKESEAVGQHVSIKSTGATAGGIVGTIKAKKLVMNDATMKPDTTQLMKTATASANSGYVQVVSTGSSNAHTGGLIGNLDLSGSTSSSENSTIISSHFLGGHAGYVAALGNGAVGGFVGNISGGKGLYISDSFTSTYIQGAGNHGVGGFIGDISGGTIKICESYVGGRTVGNHYMANAGYVVNPDTESNLQEGRYNVIATGASLDRAAGGFIGMIKNKSNVEVTDAYTTASVYMEPTDGIAGGFIGSNAGIFKADDTYTTAFVHAGALTDIGKNIYTYIGEGQVQKKLAGSHNSVLRNVKAAPSTLSSKEDYIVNAEKTSNDSSNQIDEVQIEDVPFATGNKDAYTYDSTLRDKKYPYSSISMLKSDATGKYRDEHYGDWPIAEKNKPKSNGIVNQNRLYVQYVYPFTPNTIYKYTIRFYGILSHAVKYAEMVFETDTTGIKSQKLYAAYGGKLEKGQSNSTNGDLGDKSENTINHDGEQGINNWNALQTVMTNGNQLWNRQNIKYTFIDEDGKIVSRFYIDDLSQWDGNFYEMFGAFYPGEDLDIQVVQENKNPLTSTSDKTYMHPSEPINSLFEKVDQNSDGTYTAYIANSRHLINLDTNVYKGNQNGTSWGEFDQWPKISKAIQTADIMWTRDTTNGSEGDALSLKALPYLEETGHTGDTATNNVNLQTIYATKNTYDANANPNSGVFTYQGSTNYVTSDGNACPSIIVRDTLKEYDGSNYTLENFAVTGNNSTQGSGIFTNIVNDFTVQNLKMKNVYVWNKNNTSVAAVFGYLNTSDSSKKFNINNVHILGTDFIMAPSSQHAASMVGYQGGGKLEITNSSFEPSYAEITSDGGSSCLGGLVGYAAGGTANLIQSNLGGNTINIHSAGSNGAVGGLIGGVTSTSKMTIKGCGIIGWRNDDSIRIVAENPNGINHVGGFVGMNEGTLKINDFTYKDNDSNTKTVRSVISGNNILIRTDGVQSDAGGLVGYSSTKPDIQNTDITGVNIDIISSRGDQNSNIASGGFVGFAKAGTNIRNSSITSNDIYIKSGVDAGGFVGRLINASTIASSSIVTDEGNIISTSGTAGGIIGYFNQNSLTVTDTKVYGKHMIVYVSRSGDAAGGFIGHLEIPKDLNITNCMSSLYVDARTTKYVGGFIGYWHADYGRGNIQRCYAGGRTIDGEYRSKQESWSDDGSALTIGVTNLRNYNIIGYQYVGGFVGYLNVGNNWNVIGFTKDFSSMSVTTVQKDYANKGAIGGFIGESDNAVTDFTNCYTIGLVRPITQTNYYIGAFIGGMINKGYSTGSSFGYIDGSTNNNSDEGKVPEIGYEETTNRQVPNGWKQPTYKVQFSELSHSEMDLTTTVVCDTSFLSDKEYPYPIWTTGWNQTDEQEENFYYGDWDYPKYQANIEPLLKKSSAKASPKLFTTDSDDVDSSDTDGYLTPAGLSTETKPDIVTKKQTVRKKAS